MIHQPTWLAAVKPVRIGPTMTEVTAEPTTATLSDWPTRVYQDAIAAATPACARGMPDTAVLVIGALTNPKPIPKIT